MAEHHDGKRTAEAEPEGAPAEKRAKLNLKLSYLPLRGLGEEIRLILVDQGVEFEDVRIAYDEWVKTKWDVNPYFGQVPVLEVGDHKYIQSKAIVRHLARTYGLYGKNEEEHYMADLVAESSVDWRRKYTTLVYDQQFEAKRATFVDEIPNILSAFEKMLGEKHYFLGDHICYADYLVYELIDITYRLCPEAFAHYPHLLAFHKRFEARPYIAAYLASGKRPEAVNGRSALFDGLKV